MLPLVYEDSAIAAKIVEDPQTAPIPDLHKAMYRWVELFVRRSWDMTPGDIQALRDAGATDSEIAIWAQIACMQTWWVMMGDGGGVELDGGMEIGPVVGLRREQYEESPEGLLAAAPGGAKTDSPRGRAPDAWLATDMDNASYQATAERARDRYGFVPNIYAAVSLAPQILRRHESAFELLERPQSESLDARRHALVRALVTSLNRCDYSAATARTQLERAGAEVSEFERVTGPWDSAAWDEVDRVVLEFAMKATRSAYKITEKDAQRFRDAGLDEEAYVDVLNTVAIQTSMDRLANSLGVEPDERPLLAAESFATK